MRGEIKIELRKVSTCAIYKNEDHFNDDIMMHCLPKYKEKKIQRAEHCFVLIQLYSQLILFPFRLYHPKVRESTTAKCITLTLEESENNVWA